MSQIVLFYVINEYPETSLCDLDCLCLIHMINVMVL